MPGRGPGEMTCLGTFCLGDLHIWALSDYFLCLGQERDKGIPSLVNPS